MIAFEIPLHWVSSDPMHENSQHLLVPSGNRPLPEPVLTMAIADIWHHCPKTRFSRYYVTPGTAMTKFVSNIHVRTGLTLQWISNHMPGKVLDEITLSNFIQHFIYSQTSALQPLKFGNG